MLRNKVSEETVYAITAQLASKVYTADRLARYSFEIEASDVVSATDPTVTIQKSNDDEAIRNPGNVAWVDLVPAPDMPITIAADGTTWIEVSDPTYKYFRLLFDLSAGNFDATVRTVQAYDEP